LSGKHPSKREDLNLPTEESGCNRELRKGGTFSEPVRIMKGGSVDHAAENNAVSKRGEKEFDHPLVIHMKQRLGAA